MISKVYADWSGGWYGLLDPAKTPANMFDARNMILYANGAIGPRPGLKAFNLGRTPGGKVTAFYHTLATDNALLYIDGTHVWSVDDDNTGTDVVDYGALDGVPSNDLPAPFVNIDTDFTITSSETVGGGSKLYHVHLHTASMGVIPTGGTNTLSFYGVRLVKAGFLQILYSNRLDPLTWSALGFIDIAPKGGEVVFVSEQRNHLTIVTRDGQWWVLTGVPGVNDTLRKINDTQISPAMLVPPAFIDVGDDLVYALSPVNNFPVFFDGANYKELPYLAMDPANPRASYASSGNIFTAYKSVKAIQGADNSSPAFILPNPTNQMLAKHHGAWVLHQFSVNVGNSWASDGRGRVFCFGPIQAGAGTPAYVMDLRLERPAFASDTFAQPGDNSITPVNATITFPEEWSPDGELLRVDEVVLDIIRWNTGAAANNHVDAVVTSMARGSELADGTQTKSWDQPVSSSPATQAGQRDRIKFAFGEQGDGSGWKLSLNNIRGITIRQVIVNYDKITGNSRVF